MGLVLNQVCARINCSVSHFQSVIERATVVDSYFRHNQRRTLIVSDDATKPKLSH
jgi:hypothetical protein